MFNVEKAPRQLAYRQTANIINARSFTRLVSRVSHIPWMSSQPIRRNCKIEVWHTPSHPRHTLLQRLPVPRLPRNSTTVSAGNGVSASGPSSSLLLLLLCTTFSKLIFAKPRRMVCWLRKEATGHFCRTSGFMRLSWIVSESPFYRTFSYLISADPNSGRSFLVHCWRYCIPHSVRYRSRCP